MNLEQESRIVERATPFTMTEPWAVRQLSREVNRVVNEDIPGAFVECGVWKGGSMVAVALTLLELLAGDRELYLFDTFEGMTKPEEVDVDFIGGSALETFERTKTSEDRSTWACAPLAGVRSAMESTHYPNERVHYVQGKVEDTLPSQAPEKIALLRLDTDWYASTKHELEHLFPRLSVGGTLIVDDYGHWAGSKKAVDEFLVGRPETLIAWNYTVRMLVKEA